MNKKRMMIIILICLGIGLFSYYYVLPRIFQAKEEKMTQEKVNQQIGFEREIYWLDQSYLGTIQRYSTELENLNSTDVAFTVKKLIMESFLAYDGIETLSATYDIIGDEGIEKGQLVIYFDKKREFYCEVLKQNNQSQGDDLIDYVKLYNEGKLLEKYYNFDPELIQKYGKFTMTQTNGKLRDIVIPGNLFMGTTDYMDVNKVELTEEGNNYKITGSRNKEDTQTSYGDFVYQFDKTTKFLMEYSLQQEGQLATQIKVRQIKYNEPLPDEAYQIKDQIEKDQP